MTIYKKVVEQIYASEEFKDKMHKEMMEYEKKKKNTFMKKITLVAGGLVACAIIAVVALTNTNTNTNSDVSIDLPETVVVDYPVSTAKEVVNFEGVIIKVGEDGMSFTLDNGIEVVVTDKTKLGIDGPTAPAKEDQLFEPTFRVGNGISGFTEDTNADPIIASKIYTNWNFKDPIR